MIISQFLRSNLTMVKQHFLTSLPIFTLASAQRTHPKTAINESQKKKTHQKNIDLLSFNELTQVKPKIKTGKQISSSPSPSYIPNDLKLEQETLKPVNFAQNIVNQETPPLMTKDNLLQKDLQTIIHKETEYDINKKDFPWDFDKQLKGFPEKINLKSPFFSQQQKQKINIPFSDLKARSMIKSYINGILSQNLDELSEITENSFFLKISRKIESMKKQQISFQIVNKNNQQQWTPLDIDIQQIYIWDIENILTLGCYQDRSKNEGINNFDIQRFQTPETDIPMVQILKKKPLFNDKIRVFLRFHLCFETKLKLEHNISNDQSLQEEQEEVVEQKKNQNDQKQTTSFHTMIVESEIIESPIADFQKSDHSFYDKIIKENLNNLDFYIIDFDNYMKGNELVQQYNLNLFAE